MSGVQLIERIPQRQPDILPIVEACASQRLIIDGKAEWFDEMKVSISGEAEPANVAGVRRDFRFDEDDVEHRRPMKPKSGRCARPPCGVIIRLLAMRMDA